MGVRKNARTTFHGRALLVKRIVESGWQVAAAAEDAGVSARTACKWLERFRAGGERMLHDRNSAPCLTPHATPAVTIEAVEALRHRRMSGPRHRLVQTIRRHRRPRDVRQRIAYKSHAFHRLLAGPSIRHIRTRPYTLRTNGKADRFIQTSLREWAYAATYRSSTERTEAMPRWSTPATSEDAAQLSKVSRHSNSEHLLENDT
ncbi:leucine zipper domain-containing protein [Kaistia dalseonensis]|uniref:Transposase-like protein n=1 Tax=Kaistia dalseonensis TaxID=410840 RepID=A0ABU0H7L8_9HYPH|nr:leucine zipper domain-containing protein [Kaistia dalseonensis]MCX5495676.1 leucine zipper domain-containing protein [Kaistia dalseonensis]MDQ0438270.1 transposase-like protein [Kaistia dalseonensis]